MNASGVAIVLLFFGCAAALPILTASKSKGVEDPTSTPRNRPLSEIAGEPIAAPVELVARRDGGAFLMWTRLDHDQRDQIVQRGLDGFGRPTAPATAHVVSAPVLRLSGSGTPQGGVVGWCGRGFGGETALEIGGSGGMAGLGDPPQSLPGDECAVEMVAQGAESVFLAPNGWYICWSGVPIPSSQPTMQSTGCEPLDGSWPLGGPREPASLLAPISAVTVPGGIAIALDDGRGAVRIHALPVTASVFSRRPGTQPSPRLRGATDCRFDECGRTVGSFEAVPTRLVRTTQQELLAVVTTTSGSRVARFALDGGIGGWTQIERTELICEDDRPWARWTLADGTTVTPDPDRWSDVLDLTMSSPTVAAAWTGRSLLRIVGAPAGLAMERYECDGARLHRVTPTGA